MKEKDFYNVAVYLRLSRDDGEEGASESNSIKSQRDIIRGFIRKQDDMEIFDFYVDDGWSGANFDRPAFKRIMDDIVAGRIDCVIVKDLSRLGRDYIESGKLIQQTFPEHGVRFVAIGDDYDSLTADFNEESLVLPVKNFINDAYCRDISVKVRSQQRMKRENGKYIGAFAMYGYRKDPKDKNHLVVDDYAAGIVRNIFEWKVDGCSFETMRKVDCIVVKDLSRFGRNHLEMGNYLGKIFLFLGVRFIAVNDNFDNMDGDPETLGVQLKNLVNELYIPARILTDRAYRNFWRA